MSSKAESTLIKKHNKKTDRQEWALVSKNDHDKVLEWYGPKKPSAERVQKTERRVQYFKHVNASIEPATGRQRSGDKLNLKQALEIRDNGYRSRDGQHDYQPEEVDARIFELQARKDERDLEEELKKFEEYDYQELNMSHAEIDFPEEALSQVEQLFDKHYDPKNEDDFKSRAVKVLLYSLGLKDPSQIEHEGIKQYIDGFIDMKLGDHAVASIDRVVIEGVPRDVVAGLAESAVSYSPVKLLEAIKKINDELPKEKILSTITKIMNNVGSRVTVKEISEILTKNWESLATAEVLAAVTAQSFNGESGRNVAQAVSGDGLVYSVSWGVQDDLVKFDLRADGITVARKTIPVTATVSELRDHVAKGISACDSLRATAETEDLMDDMQCFVESAEADFYDKVCQLGLCDATGIVKKLCDHPFMKLLNLRFDNNSDRVCKHLELCLDLPSTVLADYDKEDEIQEMVGDIFYRYFDGSEFRILKDLNQFNKKGDILTVMYPEDVLTHMDSYIRCESTNPEINGDDIWNLDWFHENLVSGNITTGDQSLDRKIRKAFDEVIDLENEDDDDYDDESENNAEASASLAKYGDVKGQEPGEKDIQRIKDLQTKAKGDEAKMLKLAQNMANTLGVSPDSVDKAIRRAKAAELVYPGALGKKIAKVFMDVIEAPVEDGQSAISVAAPNPKTQKCKRLVQLLTDAGFEVKSVSAEQYGTRRMAYVEFSSNEERLKAEDFLIEGKYKVNRDYSPGSSVSEILIGNYNSKYDGHVEAKSTTADLSKELVLKTDDSERGKTLQRYFIKNLNKHLSDYHRMYGQDRLEQSLEKLCLDFASNNGCTLEVTDGQLIFIQRGISV